MAKSTTKTDGSRTYEIDGKSLPSVTTILSLLTKPALMPWAVKMTAEAVQDLIYQHGTHNQLEGTITLTWEDDEDGHMGLENILTAAKKAYRKKSTEAMGIGTAVHEAIQAWIESDGTMDPSEICPTLFYNLFISKTADLTPEMITKAHARKGLEAFISWGEEHDVHILAWEQVVTDGELYAGRFDLLAEIDGHITLLDFKTSTGIWDEYWTQTNAYAACLQEQNCPPSHVAILRIDKKSGEIEFVTQPLDISRIAAFNYLAMYYKLTKGTK